MLLFEHYAMNADSSFFAAVASLYLLACRPTAFYRFEG